jgi:dipeptidyl aminopeptidase/acylaminoacyl peptidase
MVAPLIPKSVLFGNADRGMPRISPDGKQIAYLAPNNGVMNVFVRTIGKNDDRVVTSDTIRGIRSFFWQGDSERILYLQDRNGDENWHLFQTDLATRQTRDLTPYENVVVQLPGLDGGRGNELLIFLNKRTATAHDVYRLDLSSGSLTLDTENPGDVSGWTADHDSVVRAALALLPDGSSEIRYRETAQAAWRVVLKLPADESGMGGVSSVLGFTADNRRLLILSSIRSNTARLMEFDPETGAMKVLAQDRQYDVSNVMCHPATHELQAAYTIRAKKAWKFFDKAVQADFRALKAVRSGEIDVVSRDQSDRKWIVSFASDQAATYFYLYERGTQSASLLFASHQALVGIELAKMRPISFTARDGLTVHGYLTLPRAKRHRNLPLILLVHGGPWGRDTWRLNPEAQMFANRGYAVLQINFRGSTGYGKAFCNAGNREWAGKMHTDLLDGKQWAIDQGYADPAKVAIYGGSYGGYAALVGLAFTPDEFACGVDYVGPSNIVTLLKTIPPWWTTIKALFTTRVGDPDTEVEFLNSRSPVFKADQIKAPLLIAQGAHDPRVKQAESDQIVDAMRRNGKEVEYLLFPDEGHGFARPENRMRFYAAVEQFFAQHLGGRAEPISAADNWDHLRR